jgi:4'-phosphopantetheinyl transferase
VRGYSGGVEWLPPPDALPLAACDVDVWRIGLDEALPADARATLSADEEARARQFRFPHLTLRFVAARAALRGILGRYTGIPPADLVFTYTRHGKPELAPMAAVQPVAFNVSHSADVGLCAVTAGRAVGVDVERLRDDGSPFDAIERYFSPAECATLRALDPSARRDACYACWTRKEAFLKARGDGLSVPLDAFDVSCAPDQPARLLAVRGAAEDGRPWTVGDAGLIPGFAAAVVVEGDGLRIRRWTWTWPPGGPARLAPTAVRG